MSRTVATIWHVSLATLAAILYFLFVLPRWWELTGFTPHSLGTVMRIILGVLVGLSALPVVATLRHDRKPEYGTPQLALTLLTGSIVAHAVAGTVIVGTAISEIWLSLDDAGMWLFGIYGAAAAIALLGIGAFYLAFVAEMPPPPPKPIKPKKDKQPKQRRWRRKKDGATDEGATEDGATDEGATDESAEEADESDEEAVAEDAVTGQADDETDDAPDTTAEEISESAGEEASELTSAGSRGRLRPAGKRKAKKGD